MVETIGLHPTQQVSASSSPDFLAQMLAALPLLIIIAAVIVIGIFIINFIFGKKNGSERTVWEQHKRDIIEECKLLKSRKYLKPILGLPSFIVMRGVPVRITYPSITYVRESPDANEEEILAEKAKVGEKAVIKDKILLSPGQTETIGSYAGHCETMDGFINLLVKSRNQKILFIFPKLFVIRLRTRHRQKLIPDKIKDKDGKEIKKEETKILNIPQDSFSESSEMWLLNCFGLQKIGELHYLVNKDKSGYTVDTRAFIYNDLIDIALQKQIQDIGKAVSAMAEEYMRGNSVVQFLNKTDTGIGAA